MAITVKQARAYGYDNGYDAVEADLPSLRKMDHDEAAGEAFENEQHSRQYAGFSAFASAVNRLPDSQLERVWDAYDDGVMRGIEAALKKHRI